ncbi:MAG: IS1595 family transposase [Rhodobacteraceae bacterium]|nr:IS1595 family transposase [Paracoccaceae bacterium]
MTKSKSASPDFSVRDFFKRFPDDEACLEHIFNVRFGEKHVCRACGVESTFHRMSNRRAWACAACGDHVYPTAGTIFQDTRTPLQVWFYAIYLFVTTRHGVSAKELQRQLGVTYKTAWRMGHKIREQMDKAEVKKLLAGHVEIDEAYVGGRRPGKRGRGADGKTIVVGFKERGGRIVTDVVPDVTIRTLQAATLRTVKDGATISTDEHRSYSLLKRRGFTHVAVKHGQKEWAVFDVQTQEIHHTNGIESFWKLFKNSIRGTHISVSKKHMKRYLDEFTFRANHREEANLMFDRIVAAF